MEHYTVIKIKELDIHLPPQTYVSNDQWKEKVSNKRSCLVYHLNK